ncbi:hypothetical protein F5884DRAFT_800805 [Xylogone sp. PMI_703]|nr:hypothetical protein F5884DRAFT_800805 [Xylogone sp. PMI_703]
MNTVRSFWFGWGSLCVAGAGAYYFAKTQINEDRAARHKKEQQRQQMIAQLEADEKAYKNLAHSDSPSQQANVDPAPTRHAPTNLGEQVIEKSKYEASEPFRSKKGDRFS